MSLYSYEMWLLEASTDFTHTECGHSLVLVSVMVWWAALMRVRRCGEVETDDCSRGKELRFCIIHTKE